MNDKRGLSTIIVTLILIVVSLVAVAIFWVVVRNLLQTGTEGIGIGRYTLSANIKNVNLDNSTNNVSLTVERNPGQGEISGIEFIFSDGTDSEVVKETISMKELESRKFYFHLTKLNVSKLISISIAFLIKQDNTETLGDVVDKYNVGESGGGGGSTGGGTCSPTTCTSLGYECGSWSNGCGGSLSCGNCSSGQSCNSTGKCQTGACTPITCSALGYNCGTPANGTCSGTLNCGSCGTGQTCSNSSGGICAGCIPASNPCGTAVCGNVANGTCGQISCGTCSGEQSCVGGSCVVQTGNTYWVSSTGIASWTNCRSPSPLSGSSACSYSTANSNAAAGDIVYYRGGTYSGITGSAINPSNTGTAGNMITFSSYNNEDVQFTGSGTSSQAVNLNSDYGTVRSYIKVNDLHFSNFNKHLWILRGSHNEIAYCSFIGMPAGSTSSTLEWSASYIYRQATYNWIHHNTFGTYGACEPYGTDYGVVFQVGVEASSTDNTMYNLIENNEMYQGGHHVVSFNGKYNVFRDNYFHNEPWCPLGTATFSTRTTFQTGVDGDCRYNLVEGNRIGYGGPKNKDEIGGAGGTLAGAYNIWRDNEFVQVYTDAQYVTKYSGQSDVKYNHVYNNVYWHSGYGAYQKTGGTAPSGNWEDRYAHAVVVEEGSTGSGVYGNVFKNNIFYQNLDPLGTQYSIISRYYSNGWITQVPIFQVISNNWFDNAGDPRFVDISGTPNPSDWAQFDFHLQSSSPCINAGTFLTNITSSSGSGTSFTVADAGYFTNGWGVIEGDIIQLSGQTQRAQITNVNYDTNTITVGTSLSWTQGQGVSLSYEGNAPDIGAYEYH